jgi:hypothetical protein
MLPNFTQETFSLLMAAALRARLSRQTVPEWRSLGKQRGCLFFREGEDLWWAGNSLDYICLENNLQISF